MVGDSITMSEAFLIALSGITIVFIMLSCLAVLITIISKVVQSIEEKAVNENINTTTNNTTTNESKPVVVSSESEENSKSGETYGGSVKLIDVDERTAVCIMAIVSDETGIDLSELVFKKIRAL